MTQKKQLILGNFSYELTPIIFVKNLSKKVGITYLENI